MGGMRTASRYGFWMRETPNFIIERTGESRGLCDCCGGESRSVWGLVYDGENACAAYWVHWTIGHLTDTGANLDLVLGPWGDGTSAQDRVAIALVHRQQPDGKPALMVIDAHGRPSADGTLATGAMRREEVTARP